MRRWPSRQARQEIAKGVGFNEEEPEYLTGVGQEPDQEDLACRRYSKDTSCPRQLLSARFW
ncbi:hypothetical protein ACWIE1_20565 [Bacillus velezensis]